MFSRNDSTLNNKKAGSTTLWFGKAAKRIDHVRNLSQKFVQQPALFLALDEMMVRFKGRSVETHRMTNKPVNVGFKLFSLADSQTGYVYYFTPEGRVVGGRGGNEFSSQNSEGGKTYHMVMDCVDALINIHDQDSTKFCVFFDNFFTSPRTIKALRERGIGAVGTARPK